ncbi:basic membrane protein A [Allopseudospirillum japonicum]|uniref:Basic membrane protein A n=1 Tax=Allopseudospirillum japonicum TaxID=64971 RepID=A0A1H6RND9_9GAMM|nr:BMP family ABC transporter substrate-binding protein [Allopseudospirillum japonicum]SEI52712.1 basic membrane protein A [Allopseudospirillum japonicum]
MLSMVAFLRLFVYCLWACVILPPLTHAEVFAHFRPLIVLDNQADSRNLQHEQILTGARRFNQEYGHGFAVLDVQQLDDTAMQTVEAYLRVGYSPVLFTGCRLRPLLEKLAPLYPHIKFGLFNAVVQAPNVQSVLFKDQEASFLIGILAGLTSKNQRLGIVGYTASKTNSNIGCGFAQGVAYVAPQAQVISVQATNTERGSISEPALLYQVQALTQAGTDVVFALAGQHTQEVLKALAQANIWSIAGPVNWNAASDFMLTSFIKRLDLATWRFLYQTYHTDWQAGQVALGVADKVLAWAHDQHNALLLSEPMLDALQSAQLQVITGELVIQDVRTLESCPVPIKTLP